MKNKTKFILAVIANILPFAVSCFFYHGGGVLTMFLYPPFQIMLTLLNYAVAKKALRFCFLNAMMLLSSITCIEFATQLYYKNISSDTETLSVGRFEELVAFVFILVLTVVPLILRAIGTKTKESEE